MFGLEPMFWVRLIPRRSGQSTNFQSQEFAVTNAFKCLLQSYQHISSEPKRCRAGLNIHTIYPFQFFFAESIFLAFCSDMRISIFFSPKSCSKASSSLFSSAAIAFSSASGSSSVGGGRVFGAIIRQSCWNINLPD